ncbi:hypothetical protein [Streptomyces cavernae]|uniref:hypothetical protein n=1 Tax=Streptomyces cavernae TaxID=2259034 RepID=UPI001EE46909|nr:hypothetical protein [Streptomyces cavernae]
MHATLPLPTSDVDLFASDVNLFTSDVLHDRHPALPQLREADRAVRLTAYGAWGLPRYDHGRAALADRLNNAVRGMASLPVTVRTEGQ